MAKAGALRLSMPAWGLRANDGETRMILVPEGSVIQVTDQVENRQHMVEVDWDGFIVKLFAQDIRERGELIRFAGHGD